jgi:hypothetical protein
VPADEIRARREKVVLDHFHDEVEQDWDAVLSTFPHPRYEIVPTSTVHDGDSAVRGYYHETREAFPDQRHEMIALRHSDDAVIAEFYQLSFLRQLLGAINLKSPKGLLTLVRVLRGFGKLSKEPKGTIPNTPARTT